MISLSNCDAAMIADMLESYAVALDFLHAPTTHKCNEKRMAINLRKKIKRLLDNESPDRYKRKKKIHEQFKKL